MRLNLVMDEVAAAAKQITGLKTVFPYPPKSTPAPAGYVTYPETVDYDQTYQRGVDQITDLKLVLLSGDVTTLAARDKVAGWASGDGSQSVKRAFEQRTWTSCDDVIITSCEFDVETIAGVPYLAAIFKATIAGSGEDAQ